MKTTVNVAFFRNNLRREVLNFADRATIDSKVIVAGDMPKIDAAIDALIRASGGSQEPEAATPSDMLPLAPLGDSEVPVVGFTTLVSQTEGPPLVRKTDNNLQALVSWRGGADSVIEPVVLLKDAEREVAMLADMVISLQETIDELRATRV